MAKNLLVYSRAVSVYKQLLYEGVLLHVYTKRKCKEILVGVTYSIKMFCKKVEKYYVDWNQTEGQWSVIHVYISPKHFGNIDMS